MIINISNNDLMVHVYDSVNVDNIPPNADFILAYMDGDYKNIDQVQKKFPNSRIIQCTVLPKPGVRVYDCERGDLTPTEIIQIISKEYDEGRIPWIYCQPRIRPWILKNLTPKTCDNVDFWEANWDNKPTINPGFTAHQYTSASCDVSIAYLNSVLYKSGLR